MPHAIILRGDNVTYREDNSNEAITPGMLLEFNDNDKLQKHATSGGDAAAMFALENDAVGNDVTDAYAPGDRVRYGDCAKGTIVWAHLASGQNVARGAKLMSNGAGFLTAKTSTNFVVAEADEDANASTGIAASSSLRFRARVI